jgi:Rrf2 family transcriptional regulator, cysteine metabolism repressor
MELSSRVRYALLALLELASHHHRGDYLQIDQLAAGHQIPDRYLAQLLMALRRGGIVRSLRGAKGGYSLAKEPWKITVREVLTCLEGSQNLELDSQMMSGTPETMAIEAVWHEATRAASGVFQRHTLQDLLNKRDEEQRSNPMYYI